MSNMNTSDSVSNDIPRSLPELTPGELNAGSRSSSNALAVNLDDSTLQSDTSVTRAYSTISMAEIWRDPNQRDRAEVLLASYLEKLSKQFPPDEIPPASAFSEALDAGKYDIIVALKGNDVIGGIHSWESDTKLGKCLEIPYLWVDADSRNKGIGAGLLNSIKQYAKDHGVVALSIEVADPKILNNDERAAHMQDVDKSWKFWQREGFAALNTFYAQPAGEIGAQPTTCLAWCMHFIGGNPTTITRDQAISSIREYHTKVTAHDAVEQDPAYLAIEKGLNNGPDLVALLSKEADRYISAEGKALRDECLKKK